MEDYDKVNVEYITQKFLTMYDRIEVTVRRNTNQT
jgi:hypothetical protein